MDKKNTVIATVLVNAGLLLILFVTAITKGEDQSLPSSPAMVVTEAQKEMEALQPMYTDAMQDNKKSDEQDQFDIIIEKKPPVKIPVVIQEKKVEEKIIHKLPEMEEKLSSKKTTAIQSPKKAFIEIIVKKGDSLEKLARIHHSTIKDIKQANNLHTHLLRIGQVLHIPQNNNKISQAQPSLNQHAEYYIVKRGDNPWTIAMKHHLKVNDLLRLNNLDQKKAKRLRPGDRLRIR